MSALKYKISSKKDLRKLKQGTYYTTLQLQVTVHSAY